METKEKIAYLVGTGLVGNLELKAALKELQLEYVTIHETNNTNALAGIDISASIIIFEEFSGPLFDSLRRSNKVKVYGVPAIVEINQVSGQRRLPIVHSGYPLYCHHLRNCKVAVTGMRNRDQLLEFRRLILYMDGMFLEKETLHTTHLVADKVRGDKYRDAVALGKPILKPEWVEFLWEQRNHSIDLKSKLEEFKVKAFHKCKIAFDGFEEKEKNDMLKFVEPNGGSIVEPDDPEATHIVRAFKEGPSSSSILNSSASMYTPPMKTAEQLEIDDDLRSPKKRLRFELYVINDGDEKAAEDARRKEYSIERAKVMKVEWFWSSIQIEACAAEADYLFYEPVKSLDEFGNPAIGSFGNSFTSPLNFPLSDTDGGTPNSGGGTPQSISRRKRKRQRDFLSVLAANECPRFITDIPEDVETADLGGKSLDQTPQDLSDAAFATILKEVTEFLANADYKSMSSRQKEFSHLLETERNYVGILMSIVKNFKEPCENENQSGGRILAPVEIKTIFGDLLHIYALHRHVLRDLVCLLTSWNDENLIGKVYCDHSKGFVKAYNPFVNFFEAIKAEVSRCETEKPRFLAFLRIAQCRAECGKQSLADLLIRPIQRLPSTALILSNLKKHTKETNPDFNWVVQALEAMNAVNKDINEGKRKTERRLAMFDIYNEIEGFPSHMLSSKRFLVARIDCLVLTTHFGQKYDPITVLVFNDHIQFVRRRHTGGGGSRTLAAAANASVANLRSPSLNRKSMMVGLPSNSHQGNQSTKCKYKFLDMVELEHVKRVVEVSDMSGTAFSLIIRGKDDLRERMIVFNALDDTVNNWTKQSVLTTIAKQIAECLQRIDYENLMASATSSELHMHESKSVLDKATKFAAKTRSKVNKVTRALSLSGTPNKMKRTVSHMISPFSSARRVRQPDQDSLSISEYDSTCSTTTPLRPSFSTISLWGWGSKRGVAETTPKSRPTLSEMSDSNGNCTFESIQES